MYLHYKYDNSIGKWFEYRATKKVYRKLKLQERACLSLILIHESVNEDTTFLLARLKDIDIKLARFKHEKYYTTKLG